MLTKAQATAKLLEALRSFLSEVKPSTKNVNVGFVDMRDVADLRGLLAEIDFAGE